MNLYLDTSALVKNFIDEAGSENLRRLIEDQENQIWISELVETEFSCALFRRLRNHELSIFQVAEALEGFRTSITKFEILPLNSGILSRANQLIRKYGDKFALRSLDSMHAASFDTVAEKEDWIFATADLFLGNFIESLGFRVINKF